MQRLINSCFCFLFLFFILLNFIPLVHAEEPGLPEFNVDFHTTYTVGEDGMGSVTQKITLANNFSKIYASSYSLIINGEQPEEVKATQDQQNLPVDVENENGQTKIIVTFPNAVVGKDKSRVFLVNYKLPNLASKNGDVWEVNIPKLASPELINSLKLDLIVPLSFGNPAYISPEPRVHDITPGAFRFEFNKEDLTRAGVVAAFGNFQVFSFDLLYHLQNTRAVPGEMEIALPPDTAFQRVYYESIIPKPQKIRLDDDGNWLATYRVKGNEILDIHTEGSVQVFAKPQGFYPKISPDKTFHYLNETEKWPTNDEQIKILAQTLRTPKSIYDYVVGKLSYDYSRVGENTERYGGKKALENPNKAICTEFTDLFITLARAAGIPAREINGYAYTDNPQLQPLSLVADVLHAWPEYWDSKMEVWKPIDPTWEDTTGGIDFFNKFDLSHITFVIHGKDDARPMPAGSYKSGTIDQKDVQVNFGSLPVKRLAEYKIELNPTSFEIPLKSTKRIFKVINLGATAIYDLPVTAQTKGASIEKIEVENIEFLPPYGDIEIPIIFSVPVIPNTKGETIKLIVGDKTYDYTLPATEIYSSLVLTIFVLVLGAILSVFLLRYIPKRYR